MKDFFRGKSVAVVGRAAYLAHKEQGEFIDSHDVVVRIHCPKPYPYNQEDWERQWFQDARTLVGGMGVPPGESSFIPDDAQKYLGSKTHLFAPARFLDTERKLEVIYSRLSGLGVEYVLQSHVSPRDDGRDEDRMAIEFLNKYHIPVHVCAKSTYAEAEMRCEYVYAFPGIVLILEILKMDPLSLYATGFPCYTDVSVETSKSYSKPFSFPLFHQSRNNMMALRNLAYEFQLDVDSEMKELSANMWLDSRFPGE